MKKNTVLVIGLGQSGRATACYLLKQGYVVVGVDADFEREEIQKWKKSHEQEPLYVQSDKVPQEMNLYAFAVISPGISQKHPLYRAALELHLPIFSEAQLVLQKVKQKCIGITGTNGKTTLTMFLEHLLNTAHIPAKAIGNVGYPFTQYARERGRFSKEVLVCELSSYHLETLSAQALDIGILLEITPDHLDRYASFDEYAEAKLKIVQCIKPKPRGTLFVHHKVYKRFKKELEQCEGDVIMIPELFSNNHQDSYLQLTTKKEYCDFLDLVKKQAFSLETLYLGKAIAQELFIQNEDLKKAIATFVRPPHRLERVATIQGVEFINDSKATNIESVIHAVNTIGDGILLIAGGKDKSLQFEEWNKWFGSRVRKVFAIGESAEKIKHALHSNYEVELCKDLEHAIRLAFSLAKEKERVLLSPGCASFDSYKNYMHRGECFREIVTALNEECSR